MSTDQIEVAARRSAANINDSLSRAALTAQLTDAITFLSGVEAGLHEATSDGLQVACIVDAQLGTALFALRMLADRIAAGNIFEAAYVETGDDLVDETGPMYALSGVQLDEIRGASFRAGLEARESVLA